MTRHATRVPHAGRPDRDDPVALEGRLQPEELFRFSGRIVTVQTGRMRPVAPITPVVLETRESPGGVPGRSTSERSAGVKVRFHPQSMAERSNLWWLTAAIYEPLWRKHSTRILTHGTWTLEEECRIVAGMLAPVRGGSYLDAGCSAGLYARAIQAGEPEAGVILVDYSLPMLKKAVSKADPDARGVYLQCDMGVLPIADRCLDGAVMGGTLNELTEPEKVLSEMARVLKKNATAVVMHLVRDGRPGLLSRSLKPGGVWIPDENDADALFLGAGFELVDSRRAGVMRILQLLKT